MIQQILQSISAASLLAATVYFVAFLVLLFVGSRWLPGRVQQGIPLSDGTRITYLLNGLLLFVLVLAGVGVATWFWGFSLRGLYHHFWSMFVVVNVFAFSMTGLLYILAPDKSDGLWKGLWYGATRNPNWFGVDLKMFSYRPSLIGLALLNLSFVYVQYEQYGRVSTAMAVYQGMTLFYLLSTFQYEHGMLSMWDVIEEKFGWMLIWGDYVLVPFFYCLPGFFLINPAHEPPLFLILGLCVLFGLGFWMFRGANAQKNQYKQNPSLPIWGKKPETLEGRLLVSGFWGIGRKLNYTGEILVYLSWTLLTGFHAVWPYLLPLWLFLLLVHRAWRDEQRCRAKYGALWERYCARVKFRMIPFVY